MLGVIGLWTLTLGRLAEYETLFKQQDARLESYRLKVMELETSLLRAQELVAQVAEMAGVEFEYTPVYTARDSATLENGVAEDIGAATAAGFYPRDLRTPFGAPLQGFVSQEFQDSASGKYHPGIDFAVSVGTPVLSTASGEVVFAGEDPIYGLTVIVQHNDSVVTLYGHNSKLLVAEGDPVIAGGRLALSGNTGQSSAPHLHYEIRIHGKPVNPGRFLGGTDYHGPE